MTNPTPEPSETHVGRESTREEVDQSSYWDQIYEESDNNSPGWNLGSPNSELVWQLEHALPKLSAGKLIVLGCGYGHDALAFARAGFTVTAVDFSEWAIKGARQNLQSQAPEVQQRVELVQDDVFQLPSRLDGSFDYVLEHTCYCAVHPERREELMRIVHRLLKPQGQFIGLFYAHGKAGGPPYATTADEVRRVWQSHFDLRTLTMAMHSPENRAGKELWARFWKR